MLAWNRDQLHLVLSPPPHSPIHIDGVVPNFLKLWSDGLGVLWLNENKLLPSTDDAVQVLVRVTMEYRPRPSTAEPEGGGSNKRDGMEGIRDKR